MARIIIEGHDKSEIGKPHIVDLYKNTMTVIYNNMINNPSNNVNGLAIILQIDGVVLEAHCPHQQDDLELF